MEKNLKFWTFLSIWLSCTVVFGLGRVIFPLPTHNYSQSLAEIPSVSLTLTYTEADKATYQRFLVQLRDALAHGGTVNHEIPVLRASASAQSKYLYVHIKNADGKEVVFGLSVINAYLLAYKVGDNSYFFKDPVELKDAMKYLFTNTKQAVLSTFTGNYGNFPARDKTNIGLGILNEYITTLHSTTQPDSVGKALVCVIQMVAEAGRYKFIEKKLTAKSVYENIIPGGDIISRENSWGDLSYAIQYADKDGYLQKVNKQKKFERTTVALADKTVAKVSEISGDMGLLLYAPPVK